MPTTMANAAMVAAWDGDEGTEWARDWERYDRAVAGYQARLMTTAALAAGERVLDVGCGNGETSRAAARRTPRGSVLGVDLSSAMLARAQQLATAEGLANLRFEQVDAQVHPFEAGSFDVVLSRFGTMFFADAEQAFANLARAIGPGGRLVMVAWRDLADNEWLLEIRSALAAGRTLPTPPAGMPGPFAQADAGDVHRVLAAAGFHDISHEAAEEPFWIGRSTDDAFGFMSSIGVARGLLQDLDEPTRRHALDTLRDTLDRHAGPDGVVLGSAAWVISARRR